jgi:uncharacterized protein YeaO (DUF488 family)
MKMIQIKRVYEPAAKEDGARFLVERLWPRGMKKEALPMETWCRDAAPSGDLRHWFSHDPAKWKEFQRRYRAELAGILQPANRYWTPPGRATLRSYTALTTRNIITLSR